MCEFNLGRRNGDAHDFTLCFCVLTDCSEEKQKLGKLSRGEILFSVPMSSLEAEGNFGSSFNVF